MKFPFYPFSSPVYNIACQEPEGWWQTNSKCFFTSLRPVPVHPQNLKAVRGGHLSLRQLGATLLKNRTSASSSCLGRRFFAPYAIAISAMWVMSHLASRHPLFFSTSYRRTKIIFNHWDSIKGYYKISFFFLYFEVPFQPEIRPW